MNFAATEKVYSLISCVLVQLTNSNEESSDEEQMPRNWSVAQQKMKELQREIKSLKEVFCLLIQVKQIIKHRLLKTVVVCPY